MYNIENVLAVEDGDRPGRNQSSAGPAVCVGCAGVCWRDGTRSCVSPPPSPPDSLVKSCRLLESPSG